MKKALITGISGQDGAYLSRHLLNLGYKVYGAIRRSSSPNKWRLEQLGIDKDIEFVDFEFLEQSSIFNIISKISPDEIYNLGAQSFVASSFSEPVYTTQVNATAVTCMLETIKNVDKKIKFYQASTSEMFGKVRETPQNESTPFYPRSPYAVSKLYAHWITTNYRESHNLFACSGILFNHESPLRGQEFVTKKITRSLAKIKNGTLDHLELGNLDAKRDWGYADDYVKGMHLMMQADKPDDYVLATGQTYSVRDFINLAAGECGFEIEWRGQGIHEIGIDKNSGDSVVTINPAFYRPAEVDMLLGDATKAKQKLGWQPTTEFKELVSMMMRHDLAQETDVMVAI